MNDLWEYAVIAYGIVGVGLMAQGLRYVLAVRFMDYHEAVVNENWSQLKPGERRLMLGLLKGFGAGMFCVGVGVLFGATVPLRRHLPLADWYMLTTAVPYTGMLVQITRTALLPGAAPITVTASMFAVCVSAAVATFVAAP